MNGRDKKQFGGRKGLWDKSGLTPLMITFLLISFAVAVGTVIMNFGSAQVEEAAECPIAISLHVANIGGQEQLCQDAAKSQLSFTVENGVNIKVTGLIVSIIGSERAETFELNDAKMDKAGSYVGKVPYSTTTSGTIRQVKITPKVTPYDAEQICAEQAIVVEAVKGC